MKYVDDLDPNKFIRMQQAGGANAIGKPWHNKPYYRKADGFNADGTIRYLDKDGIPTSNPDLNHFVIDNISQ